MLISAGLLGLIAPQRPWLWALASALVPARDGAAPGPKALVMLVVLAFPFAGAYAGMAALARAVHVVLRFTT